MNLNSQEARKAIMRGDKFPDGLTVAESLDLSGCTGIAALPDGLTVGGWLNLIGCTGIAALPDGLTVAGSLDLSGCSVPHILEKRGYKLYTNGSWFFAGCHSFTRAKALKYWSSEQDIVDAINAVPQAGAQ